MSSKTVEKESTDLASNVDNLTALPEDIQKNIKNNVQNTFEGFRPAFVVKPAPPTKETKLPNLFHRPKDLEQLSQVKKLSLRELEASLVRTEKLLVDKHMLAHLPDKGERAKAKQSELIEEIKRRKEEDETVALMAALTLDESPLPEHVPPYVIDALSKEKEKAAHDQLKKVPRHVTPSKVKQISLAESMTLLQKQRDEDERLALEATARRLERVRLRGALGDGSVIPPDLPPITTT
eukprot:Ihof_evm3s242 gene=Ihof_evmTU3s242